MSNNDRKNTANIGRAVVNRGLFLKSSMRKKLDITHPWGNQILVVARKI